MKRPRYSKEEFVQRGIGNRRRTSRQPNIPVRVRREPNGVAWLLGEWLDCWRGIRCRRDAIHPTYEWRKSGKSTGALRLAADCSERGPGALHSAAS